MVGAARMDQMVEFTYRIGQHAIVANLEIAVESSENG